MKCDICGKKVLFGHNVSHSKRRTNRRFSPNVHSLRENDGGGARTIHICTRCLRTRQKAV